MPLLIGYEAGVILILLVLFLNIFLVFFAIHIRENMFNQLVYHQMG